MENRKRVKSLYSFKINGMRKHWFLNRELFVDEIGNLWEGKKLLCECINSNGYINDNIKDDTGERFNFKRHNIVAQTFMKEGMKEGYVANHKNEDKTDNRVSNLEWVSKKYNTNYTCKGYKNNLKLLGYSLGEVEEIAREREILAVEEVLNKIYQEGKIGQEEGMNILEQYIRGERWV